MCLQLGAKDIYINAIINCSFFWNFINQFFIYQHKFKKDNKIPKKLTTVEGYPVKIYQRHKMNVDVCDYFKNVLSGRHILLGINIGRVGIILGQSWLN